MMKQLVCFAEFIGILGVLSLVSNKFHTDVYKVDTNFSSLEWIGEKLTGKHHGTIKFLYGEIRNNHGTITGKFEFDMHSIGCLDLEPGANREKLENFLKSSNFFDAQVYPKAVFILNSAIPVKQEDGINYTHKVKGLLTIRDKTNEISFGANIKIEGSQFSCQGSVSIDRTQYDIRYRSKTFFPDIGDKVIYDEFKLNFNVIAGK